jgi:hypothetical protein
MGRNFIGVFCVEPDALEGIVGSKSDAKYAALVAAENTPTTRSSAALRRIVDGDFSRGEQPDGGSIINAFEDICRACATHWTGVEIWLSDEFPEMWDFVWGAHEAPQGLPESKWGSPAVGYWDAKSVPVQIKILAQLDYKTVAERNHGNSYEREITEILEVLEAAHEEGRGVYVFYAE